MPRLLGLLVGLLVVASVASAQTTIKVIPPPADVAAAPADAKKTASGLASKVTEPGAGKTHPAKTDLVTVHYTGWTTDGKMFDSSVSRGKPATFPLDRVIAGWTEGVQLMVQGEKRRFWIPEALAYQGQARSERHARVRRRVDLVLRIADAGAARRQGRALGREEDGERTGLQSHQTWRRRAASALEHLGHRALLRLDHRRQAVRQLGACEASRRHSRSTASSLDGPRVCN